ncbi:hypothetical protein, partial [Xanthomonas campestris]|uniref:hypothetical protein n=1 Tax=Xanthomonas campestris TaxID=339 RepID=UPI00265B8C3A
MQQIQSPEHLSAAHQTRSTFMVRHRQAAFEIFKAQHIKNAAHPNAAHPNKCLHAGGDNLVGTSGHQNVSSSLTVSTLVLVDGVLKQERRGGTGSRPDGLDTT